MNSFITGGAGFIGSHLGDRLLAEGDAVTVYDNLTSGQWAYVPPDSHCIQADLLDLETLKKSMKGHDIVWHLGASTDIPRGNRITDLHLKNCTIATYNVLEAMKENNINKLVFSSSACVYGDASFNRETSPTRPINLYGAGKLACEGLINAYSYLFGINAWIFRFANVVGDRMGHGVIFDFIQKLQRNPNELEILGDGEQERPFFLVEDCIEGMLYAIENKCDTYNLGCESLTSVTRVAEIVAEEMGLDPGHIYTAGWDGDVPIVYLDVNKIKQLGWQTSRSSDEAVGEAAKRLSRRRVYA